MFRQRSFSIARRCLLAAMLLAGASGSADAQTKKLVMGLAGIPPVFANVLVFVAKQEGFIAQQGIELETRSFDTGSAAGRAVIGGDIDIAFTPTALVINQISNAGANFIGIYGIPFADYVLTTTDPTKTCNDMKGQEVGIDIVGGARAIALQGMLTACPNVKMADVRPIALGSNVNATMVAGRLTFGVLHLDDMAIFEIEGKPIKKLLAVKDTTPDSHYTLLVVRRDRLEAERKNLVALVAALTQASRFIYDPKNADHIAEAAAPTGHKKDAAKVALKQFVELKLWASDDGMDAKTLEAVVAQQVKAGGITAGKEPVKIERLIDKSLWQEASKLVK